MTHFQNNKAAFTAIKVLFIFIIVGLLGLSGWYIWQAKSTNSIKSFEDCKKAAGSKIQESFPEVCVTKDNKRFTQQPR